MESIFHMYWNNILSELSFKLKKKKSSHLIQNCLLFFMLKIKKSETLGKFWDDKCVWEYEYCQAPDVAALMFWTPGEDQDAHQEPDYDLWCIFYT